MPTTDNGWPASPTLRIRPLVVAGEPFTPGVLDDDAVYTVLRYVAEQLHARVEPIVRSDWHQADDWGFYYKPNANNPSQLSRHSGGIAFDYNATRHPNGVPTSRTFTPAQIAEVHKILDEVENVVRWGGDYNGTPDAMHFEIDAGPIAVAAVAAKLNSPTEEDYMATTEAEKLLNQILRQTQATRKIALAVSEQVDALTEAVKVGDASIKNRVLKAKRDIKDAIRELEA